MSLKRLRIPSFKPIQVGDKVITPFSYFINLGILPLQTYEVKAINSNKEITIHNGIVDLNVSGSYMIKGETFHYCALMRLFDKLKLI